MEWVKIFLTLDEALARVTDSKPCLLLVNGRRICLVRRNGTFYAVQDACTHNSESLSKGTINYVDEIVCPLHGYSFDLVTGRESSERSRDLDTYPVKTDETGLYIGL